MKKLNSNEIDTIFDHLSIKEALSCLNKSINKIILVTNKNYILIGTLTDGDIRRGLLKGIDLDQKIEKIMNKKFFSIKNTDDFKSGFYKVSKMGIKKLPVVDQEGRIEFLLIDDYEVANKFFENSVVIMAGGLGKRLRPYTNTIPKPMLKLNGKPMLEIILENCIESGFSKFYFSVNYLKQIIMDYFEDGSRWGVNISYLEENKALGTAGSLSLLPRDLNYPFIVLNGDVLTKFDPKMLLDFHQKNNAFVTLSVRDYLMEIPYGVVEIEGKKVHDLVEKPIYSKKVNAGFYALNSEILDFIKINEKIDMPDIIRKVISLNKKVVACPIHEYWIDVGRPETLEEANMSWDK
tara:strand:+ start:972 stop:2021 length:1050 start_codon:yes stop_codon:yes gene_type:complete